MNLSHRVARQLGHDHAPLGDLEVGKVGLQAGDDVWPDKRNAWARDHDGHADLAKIGVWHSHQRTLQYARQLVDVAFNLRRVHVVAAADDQIFGTTHDSHIAAFVHLADVAGFEKPVTGKFFCRFFRHSPVPFEHVRAFNFNATDLVDGQRPAIFAAHPQIHTWQREAHRATPALILTFKPHVADVGV